MALFLTHYINGEEVDFDEVKKRLHRTTPTIEGILASVREEIALEEANELRLDEDYLCTGS